MASIEKRGPGSYRLIVEAGYDAKGKRVKRTRAIKAQTKREAEKALARFIVEVESGEYIAPEKMNFATFVQEWEKKYAKQHLGHTTLQTYKQQLKNHILPSFGHLRLDQVKPMHIVNLLNNLEDDNHRKDGRKGKLSPATIFHIHRVVRNIFKRAAEWQIIKESPASHVKPPRIIQKKVEIYTEEDTEQLFKELEDELIHWRIMITLALTTGMRRGELLALEWRHINLEQGTIEIAQSLSYADGESIIKEPKTKNSIRRVSIPSTLLPELKEYYLHCRKQKLKCGDSWEGNEHFFVFSAWNGKPFFFTAPSTWFRRFIKRKNLRPICFHALRHTSATLLINQGVHAKIISERLGHADIRTTMNVYGHALQTADQDAANKFDTLLMKKKRNS